LDGTEFFCSQKLGCPHCLTRKRANGKTESDHSMLSATVVTPGHFKVVPLAPEFIAPQDGAEKQDCERNAVRRWFAKHGARLAPNLARRGSCLYGASSNFPPHRLERGLETAAGVRPTRSLSCRLSPDQEKFAAPERSVRPSTRWTSVRKVREGETTNNLFGFLTTEPNAIVGAVRAKAMPVILTKPNEIEMWMSAPAPEALKLHRALPDDVLRIVAR
jgi:hypothetical protein